MVYLYIHFEDGKRVALVYPSLVDPDWQTALLARFVDLHHGVPSQEPRP